jgi:transcriptional regulator with XRE-family HTH domain
MKITAVTRYKHGNIYALLKKLNWTQKDLAEKSGLSIFIIGRIINLIRRPLPEQADAIQKAFGEAGEYLDVLSEWPESFAGFKRGFKIEQTADVEMENLLGCSEAMLLPAPSPDDTTELDKAIEANVESLGDYHAPVIRARFWEGKTLAEIAARYRKFPETIRMVETKALRKLRHPSRMGKIMPHLERSDTPLVY